MVLPQRWHQYRWISWIESRWVRLVVFSLALLFVTTTYYGWQHFKLMLIEDKFLQQLCEDGFEFTEDVHYCHEQDSAYNTGYTIGSSCEFAGALVAGIMLDHVGPFWTAVVGVALHFASWPIMLSGSIGAWYSGMAMTGLAVNLTAFPSFILIDIFPRQTFLMTAVVLAFQVTAAAIMPVMYTVSHANSYGLKETIYTFLVTLAAPSAVLYLFSLPLNRKALIAEYIRRGLPVPDETRKPSVKVFFKCLVQQETVIFCIWYVLMIVQYNYYFTQFFAIAGEEEANILGWMFFLQGPMAILFGWLNDFTLTIPISLVLTVMMSLTFALLGKTGNNVATLASGVLSVVSNAHIYTTKYNYAAEIYPREHFGKISGIFGLLAGALQTLNLLANGSTLGYSQLEIIYGFLCVPEYAMLGYLGWRQFMAGRHYRYMSMTAAERDRALLLDYERRLNRVHKAFNQPTVDFSRKPATVSEEYSDYTDEKSTENLAVV